MLPQHPLAGFGIVGFHDKTLLLCKKSALKTKTFHATVSTDGTSFYFYDDTGIIIREDSGFEDINSCSGFTISHVNDQFGMVYNRHENDKIETCFATSSDAIHWYSDGVIASIPEEGVIVPDYRHEGELIMYGGTSRIYAASSKDLHEWSRYADTVYRSKNERIRIGCATVIADFIHLFFVSYPKYSDSPMRIRVLRFDKNNPFTRVDSVAPVIWQQHGEVSENKLLSIGLTYRENKLFSYWHDEQGNMVAVTHILGNLQTDIENDRTSYAIQKHPENPILSPISQHAWESQAAFNAAALYEDGKVHLIYRAVGNSGVSVLGYATSSDGFTIDQRHRYPVYIPRQPFEGGTGKPFTHTNSPFVSGPGWGGCEDPRIAKVGNRYYLTYVAFDGWSPPRLAMSSISEEDFKSQNWNWEDSVLISKPGEVNKSGAILPEPIDGKYYIFHRVFPDILIDTVDSLDELDGTRFLEGKHKISPRPGFWDSRKLGIGATPIKTNEGWLTIYHGVDDRDDSRYKIGAMLLDLKDPSHVIARTPYPIIEPTEHYENGLMKYGVVYPCGAVILNDQLVVYYGGSDAVLCAATAPVKEFMNKLLRQDTPVVKKHTVSPIVHYV